MLNELGVRRWLVQLFFICRRLMNQIGTEMKNNKGKTQLPFSHVKEKNKHETGNEPESVDAPRGLYNPERSTDIEAAGLRISELSRLSSSGNTEGFEVSENEGRSERERKWSRATSRASSVSQESIGEESVLRNMETSLHRRQPWVSSTRICYLNGPELDKACLLYMGCSLCIWNGSMTMQMDFKILQFKTNS